VRKKDDNVDNKTGYTEKDRKLGQRKKKKLERTKKKDRNRFPKKVQTLADRHARKTKKLLNCIPLAENYALVLEISYLAAYIPMLSDRKTVQKGRFGPKCSFSLKN